MKVGMLTFLQPQGPQWFSLWSLSTRLTVVLFLSVLLSVWRSFSYWLITYFLSWYFLNIASDFYTFFKMVIYFLNSTNKICYRDWFFNVEPILQSWNKSYLDILSYICLCHVLILGLWWKIIITFQFFENNLYKICIISSMDIW